MIVWDEDFDWTYDSIGSEVGYSSDYDEEE